MADRQKKTPKKPKQMPRQQQKQRGEQGDAVQGEMRAGEERREDRRPGRI